MGAIVAIMGEAGDPELPERLEKMLARSPYRGSPKRHFEGGLAIAVQTRGWDASLASVGNWTVAMHGVIGNWAELAPAHGWKFPSDSSSSTKLAVAYEHLGDSLFIQLRGEFSILIYDRSKRVLLAVRDLWGRRPLFHERTPSRTYIASEIRQIRAGSGTTNKIDGDVLVQAIQWKPTYPTRTHVQGIGRVCAGRVSTFRPEHSGDLTPGAIIWSPPEGTSGPYDFDALTEELRYLIERAVDRWLLSIPFAVSLSGGVDSSTIWCVISRKSKAGDSRAAQGRPFSFSRPNDTFDETAQIKRILAATGTSDGRFIDYSRDDISGFLLRNSKRMDSPCHVALTATSRFIGAIREDRRELLLNGLGGDLVLGGSAAYLIDLLKNMQLIQYLVDLFTMRTGPNQSRLRFVLTKAVGPLLRRIRPIFGKRPDSSQQVWIHKSRLIEAESSSHAECLQSDFNISHEHQLQILNSLRMQQSLGALEGLEQLHASEGVEYGSPLIDLDILNFAFQIPPRAFSNGCRYKQLLRNVAYDSLGESIKDWKNPYPFFFLRPEECVQLENLYRPPSWRLVQENIIDLHGLESLFAESRTDADASSAIGDLVVAESVARRLT